MKRAMAKKTRKTVFAASAGRYLKMLASIGHSSRVQLASGPYVTKSWGLARNAAIVTDTVQEDVG